MDRATRFQLGLGAASFVTWGLVAWAELVTGGDRVGTFQRLLVHQGLLAVAGFGNLVTGLAWHLAGTMWARKAPHETWRMGTGALITLAGFAMAWVGFGHVSESAIALARWGGAAGLVAYGLGTIAQRFVTAKRKGAKRYAWSSAADATHLVTAAYAILAGLMLARDGPFSPLWFHLWSIGVLVGTVATVLLHLLPRFRTDVPASGLAWFVMATVAVAPAALAYGFLWDDLALFALVSAALLILACLALASLVDSTYHNRRNPQPFAPVLIVALLVGVAGTAIGGAIGYGTIEWSHLPVHAVLQLLGFLGTMVLGMGSVLLGMPRIEWQGQRVDALGPVATVWIGGVLLWGFWHYFDEPPRVVDVIPATLVLLLGVGLLLRVRALGPSGARK